MLRFLVSVILGGAALFGSGYVVWHLAPPKVPPEYRPWEDLAKYPDLVKVVVSNDVKSGVYVDSPLFTTEEEKKALKEREDKAKTDKDATQPQPVPETKPGDAKPEEKKVEDAKKTPSMQLVVRKETLPMQEQLMYGGGQCLAAAFLLALIVKVAKLWSFVGRWFIAILIGVLIAVWSQGNEYIFFNHSQQYVQYLAVYTAASFAVAGFFIAMGTGPSEQD